MPDPRQAEVSAQRYPCDSAGLQVAGWATRNGQPFPRRKQIHSGAVFLDVPNFGRLARRTVSRAWLRANHIETRLRQSGIGSKPPRGSTAFDSRGGGQPEDHRTQVHSVSFIRELPSLGPAGAASDSPNPTEAIHSESLIREVPNLKPAGSARVSRAHRNESLRASLIRN